MIKRIVKMRFHPGNVEAFREIYRLNWERIRGFPGCRHVELLEATDEPGLFFTFSEWENAESLENYRKSDVFGAVWPSTKALFKEKAQAWSVIETEP
jgi:quinol monooxygenase YgiN